VTFIAMSKDEGTHLSRLSRGKEPIQRLTRPFPDEQVQWAKKTPRRSLSGGLLDRV